MRFSTRVEDEDVNVGSERHRQRALKTLVQEAARLIREALKESATDPTTGLIDVSL
jgi:DNA replicative helicase MCM subunit Mcm2 (Cdc46/Mcm family)